MCVKRLFSSILLVPSLFVCSWALSSSTTTTAKIRLSQAQTRVKNILLRAPTTWSDRELDDKELGDALKELELSVVDEDCYRTFDPSAVAGTWTVIHAPHIAALSKLALAKFRPIEYYLTQDMKMASSVRYKSLFGGNHGWLSTSGFYKIDPENGNVVIVWDKAWWNAVDDSGRPTPPKEGIFADLIQTLGMIGFIEELSFFPIKYVDEDIAIFKFFFFTITALRIPDPKPALYVSHEVH